MKILLNSWIIFLVPTFFFLFWMKSIVEIPENGCWGKRKEGHGGNCFSFLFYFNLET